MSLVYGVGWLSRRTGAHGQAAKGLPTRMAAAADSCSHDSSKSCMATGGPGRVTSRLQWE